MTTSGTRLLGVMGWPLSHTRSPAIHTAALTALGIDAAYLALPVRPEDLKSAVLGLRAIGALGVNLTAPHKERVLPLLDDVEPEARVIGAVNTILRDGEKLVGANTDAAGLAHALEESGVALAGTRILVVGAGGAARAAVAGLARAGASAITVAARLAPQAEKLVRDLTPHFAGTTLQAVDLRAAATPAASADVLVQATTATFGETLAATLFAASLPIDALPQHAAVIDLVYAPLETTVLRTAASRELVCIDGLGMLVWQAALSIERWLGVRPPIDVMRAAATASM